MSAPRIDPRDRRDRPVQFHADPEVKAAIRDAARNAGTSASGWMSAVLLAAAGYRDTARRSARRRPNLAPRRDVTSGNAPVTVKVSAKEKEAIERKAARKGQAVSEFAAEAIGAALRQDSTEEKR